MMAFDSYPIHDPDMPDGIVVWLSEEEAQVYAPIVLGKDHRPLNEPIWLHDDLMLELISVDRVAFKSGSFWRYTGEVFSAEDEGED